MQPARSGERVRSPAKSARSSPPVSRLTNRDDAESADQRDRIDRGVKKGRGKSSAAAGDESKQSVTGMRDGRVGEQSAHIFLRERDKIADKDRKCREHRENAASSRRPWHASRRCHAIGPKPTSTIFPRTTNDATFEPDAMKAAVENRRALVDVRRPEMKRCRRDLERESNQRHDDPDGEQRSERRGGRGADADRGQRGRSRQAVNKLSPKSVNALAMLPKRKYFRPASAEGRLALIERGHDVKREPGQLEPDENHEQFFAPDEQHAAQSWRAKSSRDIRLCDGKRMFAAREEHGEKREHQADDFEERIERRDHEHAVKEHRVRRQPDDRSGCEHQAERRRECTKRRGRTAQEPATGTVVSGPVGRSRAQCSEQPAP